MVKSVFEKHGLHITSIDLGHVDIIEPDVSKVKEYLTVELNELGFELIDDKKSQTIEKIKTLIIDLVYNKNNDLKINLSDYLSSKMNQDYSVISHLFSGVENKTIEKYFIAQKIERVKELIMYDEMNLSEIAFHMNYSSVAHLSNQFKNVTGFSPTYFKNLKKQKRNKIDSL
jgi:AraC-like DNA-binding protein